MTEVISITFGDVTQIRLGQQALAQKGPKTTQRAKCSCGVAIVCNEHVAVRTHPNYQIFRINERLLYFIYWCLVVQVLPHTLACIT